MKRKIQRNTSALLDLENSRTHVLYFLEHVKCGSPAWTVVAVGSFVETTEVYDAEAYKCTLYGMHWVNWSWWCRNDLRSLALTETLDVCLFFVLVKCSTNDSKCLSLFSCGSWVSSHESKSLMCTFMTVSESHALNNEWSKFVLISGVLSMCSEQRVVDKWLPCGCCRMLWTVSDWCWPVTMFPVVTAADFAEEHWADGLGQLDIFSLCWIWSSVLCTRCTISRSTHLC